MDDTLYRGCISFFTYTAAGYIIALPLSRMSTTLKQHKDSES